MSLPLCPTLPRPLLCQVVLHWTWQRSWWGNLFSTILLSCVALASRSSRTIHMTSIWWYDHMTSIISMGSHPCELKRVETSWNELAKLPQGSSIPNELRDFIEPLLKEIGRHNDERPLAEEVLWTARKYENQQVDVKKHKNWQLLTTQKRITTCFTDFSNFSTSCKHRTSLEAHGQPLDRPVDRMTLAGINWPRSSSGTGGKGSLNWRSIKAMVVA